MGGSGAVIFKNSPGLLKVRCRTIDQCATGYLHYLKPLVEKEAKFKYIGDDKHP